MWCPEHAPKMVAALEDSVASSGCEARIYHNGVGSPCSRTRGHQGTGGTAHRTTTGIEWMPGQTRPLHCPYTRTVKGCEDCTEHAALVDRILACGQAKTYAEAEAVAVAMEEEPEAFAPLADAERVAASAAILVDAEADRGMGRLDHTEPGRAVALIMAGHRFEAAPRAVITHRRGGWALVDDDGDAYTVKGPEPLAVMRAWAVLRGVELAAADVQVTVEYGTGLVVLAPEEERVTLEWKRRAGDASAWSARGYVHTYELAEHAHNASLFVMLRGRSGRLVEVYRRRYTRPEGAKRAAQRYEDLYGALAE